MTRREQLQQQYEDALFALMMDEISTEEGKKALEENKRLQEDPAAAVPPEVTQKCIRTIKRAFAKESRKSATRMTLRVLNKVAVVSMVAILLFVGVFAASPTVRTKTLNLLIQVFDTNTTFSLSDDSSQPETATFTAAAEWLPEGFSLADLKRHSQNVWYFYQDNQGSYIEITIYNIENGGLHVDTEDAVVEELTVHDCPALMIEKNGETKIVWGNEIMRWAVSVISCGLNQDELIQFVENLQIQN